jgi:hypothetical protein
MASDPAGREARRGLPQAIGDASQDNKSTITKKRPGRTAWNGG